MKNNYFGTDGIRGQANKGYITAEFALKLGMACGAFFKKNNKLKRVIIGKDTRLSCYMLESALTAGFTAVGIDVFLLGPIPTPAVGMLTKSMRADLGIMVSASHNLYEDNGIKIFGPEGEKLSLETEQEISALVDSDLSKYLVPPQEIAQVKRLDAADGRYIESVKHLFPKDLNLENIRIVIDTANGAAYKIGKIIFQELGAEVIAIANKPDGRNINLNCGSTHPELLAKTVLAHKADIGFAVDGDADRLVVVDEFGQVIPGELILALLAVHLKKKGELNKNTLVSTIMANSALEKFLSHNGISLIKSNVGDRNVYELMKKHKLNFGGEPSGHIIFSDYCTTGDGLLTALQILAALKESSKKTISELAYNFVLTPRIINAVKINNRQLMQNKDFQSGLEQITQEYGKAGYILVRASGTEPLMRVLVEGEDMELNQLYNDKLLALIEELDS